MRSLPDPTKSFLITKLISGLRRSKPVHDTRQPISANILQKLIDVLPFITKSQYETTLYKTAFVLAFFGFLRLSEFTSESRRRPATGRMACDVVLKRMGGQQASIVQITFRRSKNNQYGRNQSISINGLPGSSLCPVRTVEGYLLVRPKMARSFFSHFDTTALTRHEFQLVLKKATEAAGLHARHFTSHSFRIGAATAAAASGSSSQQIQTAGRWLSTAYLGYIRQSCSLAAVDLI